MKRMLVLSLLIALLGGCVVVPYGYRDRDDYIRRYRDRDDYTYRGGYRDATISIRPRPFPSYGYREREHGS